MTERMVATLRCRALGCAAALALGCGPGVPLEEAPAFGAASEALGGRTTTLGAVHDVGIGLSYQRWVSNEPSMWIGSASIREYGGEGAVQFDLDEAPWVTGANLVSARLRMYQGPGWTNYGAPFYSFDVAAYPVTGAWDETVARDLYGLAFDAASAYENRRTITRDAGWREWDVTAAARLWLGSPEKNLGLRMRIVTGTASDSMVLLSTREEPQADLRPQLVLEYGGTGGPGGACAAPADCPTATFCDAGTCRACPKGCATCADAAVCTQCAAGYLLSASGECHGAKTPTGRLDFDRVSTLGEYACLGASVVGNSRIWGGAAWPAVPQDACGGVYSKPNGLCFNDCGAGDGSIVFDPPVSEVSLWALSGPGCFQDELGQGVRVDVYDTVADGAAPLASALPDTTQQYDRLVLRAPGIRRVKLTSTAKLDAWDHVEFQRAPGDRLVAITPPASVQAGTPAAFTYATAGDAVASIVADCGAAGTLSTKPGIVRSAAGCTSGSFQCTFAAGAGSSTVSLRLLDRMGRLVAAGSTTVVLKAACSARSDCAAGQDCVGGWCEADLVPPQTTIVSGPDALTRERSAAFAFASNEPGTFDCRLDGAAFAACSSPTVYGALAEGSHAFEVRARDAAGNLDSTAAAFAWFIDATPPALTLPAAQTVEATGPTGRAVSFTATASDARDGATAVSCTPASGSVFPLGETLVRCSSTDAAGNAHTGTFSVTVRDTTPPALALPAHVAAEATGPAGASVSYTATASDLVGGATAVSCVPASGSTFPVGTTTVACEAYDESGNRATGSFAVTVGDTTAPIVSVPAGVTAEATGADGAIVAWTASAQDLVGGARTVACAPAAGSRFALGQTTVTCEATDAHGNRGTASFLVTVTDTTAPALQLPGTVLAEATGPAGAAVSFLAAASDLVDGATGATCTPASGNVFPLGETAVFCVAADARGNTAGGSFLVRVRDTTAPALTLPALVAAEATGPAGATVSYPASAADAVSGATPVLCVPASGSVFAVGTTTVACETADTAGNVATGSFAVRVDDTTAPVVTVPAGLVVEATAFDGAAVAWTATAADLVDGALPVACAPESGARFPVGTTSVLCEALDSRGNRGFASFAVEVLDTTAPALQLPAPVTAEATGPSGAAVAFAATAADLVDGPLGVDCAPASGSLFPLGETVVSCAATDAAGNQASGTFSVTVVDTTPPTLVDVPADLTAEAAGPGGADITWAAPYALDLVDGTLAVACDSQPGSVFALGTATVSCEATDAAGNTASASFLATVVDTTAPEFSNVPADLYAEATGPEGALVVWSLPAAADLVDGPVAVACAPASGSLFPLGTTVVTCSTADARANAAARTFAVTVVDTTPPAVAVPESASAEAVSASGASVWFVATASDGVDGPVPAHCEPAPGSVLPLGATTIVCEATDAAGNVGTASFVAAVVDTTPPTLSGLPASRTVEATGPAGALVAWPAPVASDLVDGGESVSCAPASGSTFALGTTTVVCTARDAAGNAVSGSFEVTVQDTTAPALSLPQPLAAEATGPAGARVTYAASAADAVDGAVAVACAPASGSVFPVGLSAVTCSAADGRGNTAVGSFGVTVRDTTAPVVTVPGSVSATATTSAGAVVAFAASAGDSVDGAVATACAPASGSRFAPGTTQVVCTATDAHGNTGVASFPVIVTFSWSGVLQPVRAAGDGVYNLGRALPVKFALTGASAGIADLPARLWVAGRTGTVAAVSSGGANEGNAFRYDPRARQYLFNLATETLGAGTFDLLADLGDGVRRSVRVTLK